MFNLRCLDDIPATPGAFPRNVWLCLLDFAIIPIGPPDLKYEVCWAASEASLAWSKILKRPVRVCLDGSPYIPAPTPIDTQVDATCFMLAVYDKVHEM